MNVDDEDGIEYEPCKVTDFNKLRFGDGTILYKLYAQDGSFIDMSVPDNYSNRLFISWVQIHDRYVVHGDGP